VSREDFDVTIAVQRRVQKRVVDNSRPKEKGNLPVRFASALIKGSAKNSPQAQTLPNVPLEPAHFSHNGFGRF
jgi:hypothetical protein